MKFKKLFVILSLIQPSLLLCEVYPNGPLVSHLRQATIFIPEKPEDIKMPRKISGLDRFARKHLKSYKHYRRRLDQYDTEERYNMALKHACFEFLKKPDDKELRAHIEHITALKYPRTWWDRHPHASLPVESTISFFSGIVIYTTVLGICTIPLYAISHLLAKRI